jgi:predicted CXXCH cytochrome family protein
MGRFIPGNARRLAGVALAACVGALVALLDSCATEDNTVAAPLPIQGATYVGDKVCADCHANITRAFPASPHARLHLDSPGMPGQSGCESCHGPGSKHVALGGSGSRDRFIINPGKTAQACFTCHLDVNAQFHLPRHHPVLEGRMNCVDCHDPHGMDIMKPAGGLGMSRLNESCARCHPEQTRPVIFEHPALREGCASCHDPHGSINEKLLTIRDSNLCLRCHAQVRGPAVASGRIFIGNIDHTGFVRLGTCWSAGCHTAVHGSNVQPFYFY